VTAITVTLIGKPGCHLCDEARHTVTGVMSGFGAEAILEERSILDESALNEKYGEEIPVVLINGAVHTIWRVDGARFRQALEEVGQ
jgi:glycine/serine hydroxymethyltransferase